MKDLALSFGVLLAHLQGAIGQMEDPRQLSNGQRYRLQDVVLAAFSVFFMQCASFLSVERQLDWPSDNYRNLATFGENRSRRINLRKSKQYFQ
jgi:hypothetical protein